MTDLNNFQGSRSCYMYHYNYRQTASGKLADNEKLYLLPFYQKYHIMFKHEVSILITEAVSAPFLGFINVGVIIEIKPLLS